VRITPEDHERAVAEIAEAWPDTGIAAVMALYHLSLDLIMPLPTKRRLGNCTVADAVDLISDPDVDKLVAVLAAYWVSTLSDFLDRPATTIRQAADRYVPLAWAASAPGAQGEVL